jgi:hypothetical protein
MTATPALAAHLLGFAAGSVTILGLIPPVTKLVRMLI